MNVKWIYNYSHVVSNSNMKVTDFSKALKNEECPSLNEIEQNYTGFGDNIPNIGTLKKMMDNCFLLLCHRVLNKTMMYDVVKRENYVLEGNGFIIEMTKKEFGEFNLLHGPIEKY